MKRLVQIASLPIDIDKCWIDVWYDKESDNWIVQLKDKNGNQVGETIYKTSKLEASKVKKTEFVIPENDLARDEQEDRYGFNLPHQYLRPVQALLRLVQEYPKQIQVWDAKSRILICTVVSKQSSTLVNTISHNNQRGTFGTVPLIKGLESRQLRLWVMNQEVTFKQLNSFAGPNL